MGAIDASDDFKAAVLVALLLVAFALAGASDVEGDSRTTARLEASGVHVDRGW